MRNIAIIFIGLFLSASAFGQKPEPVYSFALVLESPQWYKDQINAWDGVIKQDSTNGLAWYYYYYATRNLLATNPDDKRSISVKKNERLELVKEMGKAIPNSFEYHLCMWKENWDDPKHKTHLEKVHELGENRIEHIDFIINDGEFERDMEKRSRALIKKWEAGLISPGMANYNRNVLAGLSKNAILLTVGDNDTYPAWYVQATGYRSDVSVLNLSLLRVESYRKVIFEELGVKWVEIDWDADSTDNPNHVDHFYKKLIPALSQNTKGCDLYLGLTAMGTKNLFENQENHLYLTGLTYKYDTTAVDERALLKRNFEHRYSLDYISQSFYHDISAGLVKQINQNYIVPMLKLYEHYDLSGDMTRKAWLKQLLLDVSEGCSTEEEVKKHLNK